MQDEFRPHSDPPDVRSPTGASVGHAPPVAAPAAPASDHGHDDPARLRRLLTLFFALAAVLAAPSIAFRIQYALVSAEERARYDVGAEHLHETGLHQLSQASRMLTNKVTPSVVSIRTARRNGEGQGSGVIVDEQGYIVTNHHVVEGVGNVEVELSDGRRASASVIGVDRLIDIAVLKTELKDLIPAQWGDSDELEVGELVWAVGSPFGLEKSTTLGILSQKGRYGITDPNRMVQEFLQTDAAVNPGNSGGPLVNSNGEIVGINTAIVGQSYQGVSFAIPSSLVKDSYEQLRDKGHVDRGFLGVILQPIPDPIARRLHIEPTAGVLVRGVEPNTPAALAGIEPGDVILQWNGQSYGNKFKLSQVIAGTPVGATVPVKVLRYGGRESETLDLEVTITTRPTD